MKGVILKCREDGTYVKYIDDVGNAVFLDSSTGEFIRYVDPQRGFEKKLLGIIVASAIWVAGFFYACWKTSVSILTQSSLLTVAILGLAVYRIQNTGNDENLWRPAWQIVFGIVWAWGIALANWVVQSNWRFPHRALIVLLFHQCLYVMVTMLLHRRDLIDLTMIYFVFASILLLCWSLVEFRYGKARNARTSERKLHPSMAFDLKSLFLWTAIFAGYIGFLVQVQWPTTISLSDCLYTSVDSFVAFAVAITTWRSTRRPASCMLVVPSIVAIAIVFETSWTVGRSGSPQFEQVLCFFSCQFVIIAGLVGLSSVNMRPSGFLPP